MVILSSTPSTLCGRGAFGDILEYDDDSVVKVFRRMEVTYAPVIDPSDHDVVVRATWDAEAKAYELANQEGILSAHLAPWFGRLVIDDVVNERGQSIANEYQLRSAFRMGKIPGRDTKVGQLRAHPLFSEIDSYLDQLVEAGIKFPWDGSVFIPGLANGFTVVDIATWSAMGELSEELASMGRLSDTARSCWGRNGAV